MEARQANATSAITIARILVLRTKPRSFRRGRIIRGCIHKVKFMVIWPARGRLTTTNSFLLYSNLRNKEEMTAIADHTKVVHTENKEYILFDLEYKRGIIDRTNIFAGFRRHTYCFLRYIGRLCRSGNLSMPDSTLVSSGKQCSRRIRPFLLS